MTSTPPVEREVASWKLVLTLSVAGALAGLLLVFVYYGTQPAIQAHKAERLRAAVEEVLGGPERYETRWIVDGALVDEPPAGADPASLERLYVGYAADGAPVGVAFVAAAPGYQDVIQLMLGYDPARRTLLGMKVLESRETPGLGDKIEKDADFVGQFAGAQPPLEGVKKGKGGDDPHEVDMITGATISSRAVIQIIDRALARLGPVLDAAELGS
jgi:electron transport complex protein RnfG